MSSSWMVVLFAAVVGLVAVFAFNAPSDARPKEASKQYAVTKSDQDWKKTLTRQQFRILRQKGTERAFTGEYWNEKRKGLYRCAGCNQPLFHSDHKFKSGTGWPSYYKAVAPGLVETETDTAYGMGAHRNFVAAGAVGTWVTSFGMAPARPDSATA